jgi:hypothetical protein
VPRGLQASLTVCAALVAALASVAEADARQGALEFPGESLTAEFRVRASNGYVVGVYASRNRVTLGASRPHSGANYEVKGVVTKDGIRAGFGRLGRVAVAFEEKSIRRAPPFPGCVGGSSVTRTGVFTGTIRFRSEGGYTEVVAHRASGKTLTVTHETCRGGSGGGDFGIPDQVDLGASCGPRGFAAIANRSVEDGPPVFPDEPSDSRFFAYSREHRGRIGVTRLAIVAGKRTDFLFDDAFSFATVAPPPPFHGTATLGRGADGGRAWEGTLSVSLPGRELDLVDPRFKVLLKRYRGERVDKSYVLPPRTPCHSPGGRSVRPSRMLFRELGTLIS